MGLLHGLFLLVVGALGAETLVSRDRRGARVVSELEPYKGWIGVASAGVGAWRVFWALLELPVLRWFNHWLLRALDGALLLSLGLVLGVAIFRTWMRSPTAQSTVDGWTRKLQPYREKLGVTAMVLGSFLVLRAIF
ncbi:MAG TPA: hypothetical protein VLQ79_04880 [Myxococcaceae bacterium]|nr:hypothetical protein [Myxococcaceae bacterium]